MKRDRQGVLQHIGRTPLVPLERIARGLPVRVLVKCEHLNPGGSIKDRIAVAIVEDAEEREVPHPGMTWGEATAGNTGAGLALVAAARGYGLVCVMPEKMSIDKRVALASLGARVVITPNAPPASPDNFRNVAQRMAQVHGWFLTDQFRNPANVRVHEETTGAEILEQTNNRVGAFVAGAGTGGTLTGVGRRLKAALPRVRVVLADPVGSALADGVETGKLGADGSYVVEGIGGSEAPPARMGTGAQKSDRAWERRRRCRPRRRRVAAREAAPEVGGSPPAGRAVDTAADGPAGRGRVERWRLPALRLAQPRAPPLAREPCSTLTNPDQDWPRARIHSGNCTEV